MAVFEFYFNVIRTHHRWTHIRSLARNFTPAFIVVLRPVNLRTTLTAVVVVVPIFVIKVFAASAVLAGNDMLCCTDFEFQIPAVIQAVEHGQIPEEQIDQAVLRILLLKEKLGLI